jgi:carbon-monoxide dehydrogenase medium subunit
MYPSRFRYESPKTVEEAIRLLSEAGGEGKILAGGQSLIPMMKLRFATPQLLVDINGVAGLDHLDFGADGSIRVGALCRHATLERSAELKVRQPTMAAAAQLVADPIVRNRGTLVGSLCHADPQGDWAAVMVALNGQLVAQGPSGRRSIPVTDLVRGPFQTSLAPDEIGVEAVVPAPAGVPKGGYLKLERRIGDFATVAVAVAVDMQGNSVARAGIGLAAVGSQTINAAEAAAALTGGPLTEDRIVAAGAAAAAAAKPRSDHRGSAAYKRQMVSTFVVRILNGVAASMEKVA